MRLRGRVDANQAAIVSALRKAGASVAITSSVGNGFVDAVIGVRHRNFLLEIKDGKGKLTTQERHFAEHWNGQVATVRTPEEALIVVGLSDSKALLEKIL